MTRRSIALLLVTLLTTACSLAPGTSPSPSSTAVPSVAPPTVTPAATSSSQPSPSAPSAPPSGSTDSLYLRAWYSQSIPPQYTFSWLPPVTIADGEYLNGSVAIPAIFPGPLLIVPVSRSITLAGTDKIVAEARRLGLLGGTGDFTGGKAMPGSKLADVEMMVDGQSYELTGFPDATIQCIKAPCEGAPGSPEAFSAFWQELLGLEAWLPGDLGPSRQYTPQRVALMLTDVRDTSSSPPPTVVDWPLQSSLASSTCIVLSGADLQTMLPVLASATQLTVFAQDGTVKTPVARVLVPGEPSPCPA